MHLAACASLHLPCFSLAAAIASLVWLIASMVWRCAGERLFVGKLRETLFLLIMGEVCVQFATKKNALGIAVYVCTGGVMYVLPLEH